MSLHRKSPAYRDLVSTFGPRVLIVFMVALPVSLVAQTSGLFDSEETLFLPPALSLAAPDLNGDGLVDLAAGGSGDLSVFTNNEGFLTSAGEPLFLNGTLIDLAAGDVDGDQNMDLVVTDSSAESVIVLYGRGDGTFDAPQPHGVGFSPRQAVIAELSGDTRLDIAAVNTGSSSISILRATGPRTFAEKEDINVGSSPHSIVAGDFNRDGRGDLVVAIGDEQRMNLLTGAADGSFVSTSIPAGLVPRWLTTGDFDGDTITDVALASQNSGRVDVLLGDGEGNFPTTKTLQLEDPVLFIIAGELSGDSNLDIAVIVNDNEVSSNRVDVFRGVGDGSFDDLLLQFFQRGTLTAEIADFEGDGDGGDLVVGTTDDTLVTVFRSRGDGTFRSGLALPLADRPTSAAAGDLDGDGQDEAVASLTGGLTVFSGSSGYSESETISAGGAFFEDVAIGDLNGDPFGDIVAVDFTAGQARVFHGRDGALPAPGGTVNVGVLPNQIVLATFDAAGLDGAVLNSGSNDITLLRGGGDGALASGGTLTLTLAGPNDLVAADVSGDGAVDIIVAGDGGFTAFFGDGQGGFPTQKTVDQVPGLLAVTVGSLDGVSSGDLIFADDRGLQLFASLGDGNFGDPVPVNLFPLVSSLSARDVTGDGAVEVFAASSDDRNISVVSRVDGSSYEVIDILRTGDARTVEVRDLNGDGNQDVLTSNRSSETLTVIFGRNQASSPYRRGDANADDVLDLADAVFILNALFAGKEQPTCEKTADANDDGGLDVADPIFLLNRLFAAGDLLNEPTDTCGTDPTADDLTCRAFAPCQ